MKTEKYEGVLKKVEMLQRKNCYYYTDTKSKSYKILKLLCILSTIWAVGMNLIFLIGMLFNYIDKCNGETYIIINTGMSIAVSVCTVTIIASLILHKLKAYIPGCVLNVISSIVLIVASYSYFTDEKSFLGLEAKFFTRHFIPLALMSLFLLCMTVIAVRARKKADQLYNEATEKLYTQYHTEDMSADAWDEFLKNYNPENESSSKNAKKTKKNEEK